MQFYLVMDNFYNVANFLHFAAIVMLLARMWWTRSCSGISGKTQIMMALVYTTRYLDAYVGSNPLNIPTKTLFIVLGYFTLVTIFVIYRNTYEKENDICSVGLLVAACIMMAVQINYNYDALEVFWAFSIYTETVAIVPQIFFTFKSKQVAPVVLAYVSMLFIYRVLYIFHWVDRYNREGRYDAISSISALVQILIYVLYFLAAIFVFTKYSIYDKAPQDAEGFLPTNGENYKCNVSTIVLTPESLKINDEKVSKAMA